MFSVWRALNLSHTHAHLVRVIGEVHLVQDLRGLVLDRLHLHLMWRILPCTVPGSIIQPSQDHMTNYSHENNFVQFNKKLLHAMLYVIRNKTFLSTFGLQKKPCLIPATLADSRVLLTWDTVSGFCCSLWCYPDHMVCVKLLNLS